jgi:hypothetical protein
MKSVWLFAVEISMIITSISMIALVVIVYAR